MKKLGLVVTSFIALCLLTGCGEKKLECSYEEDGEKSKLVLTFDSKDKITSGTMTVTNELDEEYKDDELDSLIEEAEKQAKDSGYDAKITKGKDNTIVTTMKFNSSNLKELFDSEEDLNKGYDEIKKLLESSKATCK